jgi:topoisomerase IA-like protein
MQYKANIILKKNKIFTEQFEKEEAERIKNEPIGDWQSPSDYKRFNTLYQELENNKIKYNISNSSNKEEENIEICKGKSNYYLKQNKKSISLTDNADNEPEPISWLIANEMFKHNQDETQSRILKTFEEDEKLSIVNARYGPCIEYAGKKTKVFVSIPKGKSIDELTFEICAELVNKKKEALKNGVKPKPFRKFTKKS